MICGEVHVCPQCQRHVFPYLDHATTLPLRQWWQCPRCDFLWEAHDDDAG